MNTVTLAIGVDVYRQQKQQIEGPTRKQAAKMAARIVQLRAMSDAAATAGQAFDYDCEAWDIENDLRRYGFARLIPAAP